MLYNHLKRLFVEEEKENPKKGERKICNEAKNSTVNDTFIGLATRWKLALQ